MKALIYSPYLNTLGGGERYLFQIAAFLIDKNYTVNLAWYEDLIKKMAYSRLYIDIDKVQIDRKLYYLFTHNLNVFERYQQTASFNIIIFVSDGSIPLIFGKKNILHFQVPFNDVKGRNLSNQIKLKLINNIICNSFYTKKIIDNEFNVCSQVVYPSFSEVLKPETKDKLILSVGRFDNLLHNKKQDVLIKTFRQMQSQLHSWKLIVIGGVLKDDKYLLYLKKLCGIIRMSGI